MRGIFSAILACCASISGPALAKANPELYAMARGIDEGSAQKSARGLVIRSMRVAVHVQGRLADVTIEATIANTAPETDEGRFALELPTDAVLTGYALDVDGAMIDGTLLDQPKARNVYEDEVRKGIDPGLAEMASVNRFEARIFPIIQARPRTIRVSFSVPFDPARGLVLPLAPATADATVAIDLTVEGYRTAPEVVVDGKRLSLDRKGNGNLSAQYRTERHPLRDGLAITGGTLREGMLLSRHAKGGDFFQIGDSLHGKAPTAPEVGRLRVYWDRSLSRRDDLLDREIALLGRYVETARPDAVDLVTFASDTPTVTTALTPHDLAEALGGITYRGATRFAGLDKLDMAAADLCLLFTDGLPTLEAGAGFDPDCRTMIVTSAADADGVRLGRLAQDLRGELLRLTPENGEALLSSLLVPAVTVVAARDDSGRRLPMRALPAAGGGWFAVGKAPDQGDVHLLVSGLRKGLTERIYRAADSAVADVNAAGALWASQELAKQGDDPLLHDRAVKLARTYQVAAPGMAFLVLERPDQYLAADVTPPKDFPKDWLETYRQARRERDENEADRRKDRFDFVLEQWARRKAWWNTRFVAKRRKPQAAEEDLRNAPPPPPPPPVVIAPAPLMAPAVVASPAPMAPPPPAAEAAQGGAYDTADLIVTARRRNGAVQATPTAVIALTAKDVTGKTIKLDLADVLSSQPYIAALKAARPGDRLVVLAEQEKTFGTLPAFYLETSEWFRGAGDAATARGLLLSALELSSVDDETRQIVAFRLERDGELDRAIAMFERIAASADFRPQPARDLALALAERGRLHGKGGVADLERAFDLLTHVALDPTISDFDGIETIALMEANSLIPQIDAAGGEWSLDKRLVSLIDTDVRIVIEWTNDDADIDLWVIEPNGEKVYYGYQTSTAGGTISNDMTDGYGPEEYVIHHAPAGEYAVRINGYDADRINPNGNGRVMVRMIRDFGRTNARETLIDADLGFEKGSDRNAGGGKAIARMTVSAASAGPTP